MAEAPKIPEQKPRPEGITSSLPEREGLYESFEGTPLGEEKKGAPYAVPAADAVVADATVAGPFSDKDPELKAIEGILADGMEEFFLHLDKKSQWEFKTKGEETAEKIKKMLHTSVYKIKDIVSLIVGWLRGLPGINRFFLEQEAKIKADRIVERFKQ